MRQFHNATQQQIAADNANHNAYQADGVGATAYGNPAYGNPAYGNPAYGNVAHGNPGHQNMHPPMKSN